MKDEEDLKVHPIQPVSPQVTRSHFDERKRQQAQHHRQKGEEKADKAGRHFQTLASAAEKSHESLTRMKSPYRFCVYQEDDDVFIDVVILGEDGKIKKIEKKNITDDEVSTWLNHIENGYGLLLDSKG